jgi:hypothetical protein
MKLKALLAVAGATMMAGSAYGANLADCCKEGAECCKQHKECCKHDKPAPNPGEETAHQH